MTQRMLAYCGLACDTCCDALERSGGRGERGFRPVGLAPGLHGIANSDPVLDESEPEPLRP